MNWRDYIVTDPEILAGLTPEALQAVFAFAAEILKDEDYVVHAKAVA